MMREEYLPKVSIIVPTYNVEEYLRECMDSVINQTLKEIEIICIDDGATDNSGKILDDYARKDRRVKVFHNENGGYGKAMNYGLMHANGEYIGIVEPDDYVLPDMFEKLYEEASEKNLDWIKSNFKRFYGEQGDRDFEEVPLSYEEDIYGRVIVPKQEPEILKLTMNIWTGIYKNQFLRDNQIWFNNTPGASFQDNGFWIQTLTLADRVYFMDEYYYMNRRDNPNSSIKNMEKAFCVIEEFKFIDEFLVSHREIREYFIYYYVLCKLVGYIGVFNRSSEQQKILFVLEASEELKKHMDAGEIDKNVYGPTRWRQLNQIIADPIQFFVDDTGKTAKCTPAQKQLVETYEKIAQAQNELIQITDRCREGLDHINNANSNEICDVKISVIVPVYNMQNYIAECLDSILNQSLKEIEVICVDDGSTDNSFNTLLRYMKVDKRVRVYGLVNSGSGVARNKALMEARGEYVAFMDADDWYPDEWVLEKLYNKAEEKEVFICGGSMSAYKDGELIEPLDYYLFEEEGMIWYEDYQMDYGYTRYIYNLDFLKKNDICFPDYSRFQDPVFFVKAMIAAEKFYAIPEITYCYRKGHKRIKWSEKQCTDVLCALKELLYISSHKGYLDLYNDLVCRVENEYFEQYARYLCHNSVMVCEAFNQLLTEVESIDEILSKLFCYMAANFVIPLRKSSERKIRRSQELQEELIDVNKRLHQAYFEIDSIRISWTYKIGRFFTFIPRKVRSVIKGVPS